MTNPKFKKGDWVKVISQGVHSPVRTKSPTLYIVDKLHVGPDTGLNSYELLGSTTVWPESKLELVPPPRPLNTNRKDFR